MHAYIKDKNDAESYTNIQYIYRVRFSSDTVRTSTNTVGAQHQKVKNI
jgi:hypothetical protein